MTIHRFCSACGKPMNAAYYRKNPEHLCTACLADINRKNVARAGGRVTVDAGYYAIVASTRGGVMWTGAPVMDSQELRNKLYGDSLPIGTLVEYWNPVTMRRCNMGIVLRVVVQGDALALERVVA